MSTTKSITFKKARNGFLHAIMPNGEPLPYQTEVTIFSKVGDITRCEIKAVALDERIVTDEVPVYTIIINADPAKIDTGKLLEKLKTFFLIEPCENLK